MTIHEFVCIPMKELMTNVRKNSYTKWKNQTKKNFFLCFSYMFVYVKCIFIYIFSSFKHFRYDSNLSEECTLFPSFNIIDRF